MKNLNLIIAVFCVCSTLCYAQENDPFGLYKNSSSSSTSQKQTTSNSEKKELLDKIAKSEAKLNEQKNLAIPDCSEFLDKELSKLEKENLSLNSKINDLQKSNEELNAQTDKLKKINKQLLEQIKGLQIEISELKMSQKKWK